MLCILHRYGCLEENAFFSTTPQLSYSWSPADWLSLAAGLDKSGCTKSWQCPKDSSSLAHKGSLGCLDWECHPLYRNMLSFSQTGPLCCAHPVGPPSFEFTPPPLDPTYSASEASEKCQLFRPHRAHPATHHLCHHLQGTRHCARWGRLWWRRQVPALVEPVSSSGGG